MTTSSHPLSAPLYGASLPQAISRLFRKYATFSGRASRAEYWWVALTNVVVYLTFGALALALGTASGTPASSGDGVYLGAGVAAGLVPLGLWLLATFIPGIAVTVRRLHDAGFSGWTILLNFIPWIGALLVTIFALLPPNPAGARFDSPAPISAE